jgi:hypothetical protein
MDKILATARMAPRTRRFLYELTGIDPAETQSGIDPTRRDRAAVAVSAPELADHRERFGDRVIAVARLHRMRNAAVQVVLEQLARKRVQR